MAGGLSLMDDDGNEVVLDDCEADSLLAVTCRLDAATVSACPDCRSRVLATVALLDVLDAAPPHARGGELVELADDAPTLHLYVVDLGSECEHLRWRDPLYDEWYEIAEAAGPHARQ
jgi:hypothetical protein